MSKNIAVVNAETGTVTDLGIEPGTKASEIISQLGLSSEYVLSSGRGQEPFGADENVYPEVSDGAKLFSSTPVEVA